MLSTGSSFVHVHEGGRYMYTDSASYISCSQVECNCTSACICSLVQRSCSSRAGLRACAVVTGSCQGLRMRRAGQYLLALTIGLFALLTGATPAPALVTMGRMPPPSALPAIKVMPPPAANANPVQPAMLPAPQPAANITPSPVQPAPIVQPAMPQPAANAIPNPGQAAPVVQPAMLPAPQPAASVAVPTGLFLGDGVLPLPQKLMKKIRALEFIEMRELLPEEWLGSLEDGDNAEHHSCCNSASRKRKPPVTNIFSWMQGYASLVGALATVYPAKVPELMAYQTTILRCYRDFEGAAWAQYDRAYRRQAALSKDLNWSRINTTLYSLCFAGRAKRGKVCTHCLSNNHQSDACPEAPAPHRAPTQLGSSPAPQEICRLYNAKGGPKCHYKSCKFAHSCSRCRGSHPVSSCHQGREAAAAPPTKRSRSEE